MVLRESKHGPFYGCVRYPSCNSTHGAHKGTGEPLGTPADKETKQARIDAHDAFDELWKSGEMTRKEAYGWLCEAMDLPEELAHIGKFDKEQCEELQLLVMKEQEI